MADAKKSAGAIASDFASAAGEAVAAGVDGTETKKAN